MFAEGEEMETRGIYTKMLAVLNFGGQDYGQVTSVFFSVLLCIS